MIIELKSHIARFKKERTDRKFSWREQRSRLHKNLREYFNDKSRESMEEKDDYSWIHNLPISQQMSLKSEVNQEIRQRRFKKVVQLELVTRFRTVDLKSKVCKEILENAHTRARKREWWPVGARLHSIPE